MLKHQLYKARDAALAEDFFASWSLYRNDNVRGSRYSSTSAFVPLAILQLHKAASAVAGAKQILRDEATSRHVLRACCGGSEWCRWCASFGPIPPSRNFLPTSAASAGELQFGNFSDVVASRNICRLICCISRDAHLAQRVRLGDSIRKRFPNLLILAFTSASCGGSITQSCMLRWFCGGFSISRPRSLSSRVRRSSSR